MNASDKENASSSKEEPRIKRTPSLAVAAMLTTWTAFSGQIQAGGRNAAGGAHPDLSIFPDLPSRAEITFEIIQ